MNPTKRSRLEQAALRAAQKAIARKGGAPLSRAEIGRLRVQTVDLSIRLFLIALGVTFISGGIGIIFLAYQLLLVGGALSLVGVLFLGAGLIGWSVSLDRLVNRYGPELVNGIVNFLLATAR